MARPDLSAMHRSELEATVVDQAKIMERFRRSIANIALGIEDEGDRAYFGSTNDADELREVENSMLDSLNVLECPWMHGADLYADLRRLREQRRELLEALGWFVADDRFQVSVGGNPDVVDRMIASAQAVYGKAQEGSK